MRKVDVRTWIIWIYGIVFAYLGIGSTKFCIQNPEIVTSQNWASGIILSIGGLFLIVSNIYFLISESKSKH